MRANLLQMPRVPLALNGLPVNHEAAMVAASQAFADWLNELQEPPLHMHHTDARDAMERAFDAYWRVVVER